MFFPTNLIVALIIAIVYIFISFKIELPEKYKKKFRIYSIVIHTSFIAFLVIFALFISSTLDNTGLVIFSYGLDLFYVLIALPLLIVLTYLIGKWIIGLKDFSIVIRYIVLFIILTLLIGVTIISYIAFIFTFYGFAP